MKIHRVISSQCRVVSLTETMVSLFFVASQRFEKASNLTSLVSRRHVQLLVSLIPAPSTVNGRPSAATLQLVKTPHLREVKLAAALKQIALSNLGFGSTQAKHSTHLLTMLGVLPNISQCSVSQKISEGHPNQTVAACVGEGAIVELFHLLFTLTWIVPEWILVGG